MTAKNPGSTMLPYREFIESDIFTLQPSNSERRFKIHETLLRSISEPLRNACEKFKEQKERHIHFKDVPETLLVAFLEWAYTRNYSDQINLVNKTELASQAMESLHLGEISTSDSVETGGAESEPQVQEEKIASKCVNDEGVMHPLLLHIGLYAFGDRYLIAELQAQAKENIANQLKSFKNLNEEYEREAVLDLVEYAFNNLREEDSFLQWLGMFVSYRLDKLKQSSTRLGDLLCCSGGALARILIRFASSTPRAPWDSEEEVRASNYPVVNRLGGYEKEEVPVSSYSMFQSLSKSKSKR